MKDWLIKYYRGAHLSAKPEIDSLLQLPLLLSGLTDFLESVLAHLQVYHVRITYLLSVYFYLLDRLDMKPLWMMSPRQDPSIKPFTEARRILCLYVKESFPLAQHNKAY